MVSGNTPSKVLILHRSISQLSRLTKDHTVSNNKKFAGKYKNAAGYVLLLLPNHPNADSKGYYYEHRFVMEQHLGRYLESYEHVHHKNHVKDDNRVENLEITSNANHAQHHTLGRHKDYSNRICFECGSDKTHVRKGYPPNSQTPCPEWHHLPYDETNFYCSRCYKRLMKRFRKL